MSELKQTLEIKQSLSMTHELQQSIKILQLPSIELLDYVSHELETNPLLASDDNSSTDKNEEPEQEEPIELDDDLISSAVYEPDSSTQYDKKTSNNFGKELSLEDNPEPEKTLRNYIIEQIYLEIECTKKRIIALYLTDMLDDNGYIDINYKYITKMLKCGNREINDTLKSLQYLDPAGIFSRSLKECLSLQLEELELLDKPMNLVLNNLDLVANAEFGKLSKITGLDKKGILQKINQIRLLNPKPGNRFGSEIVQTVIPDVFLKKDGKDWLVELNETCLPRVLVNKFYYNNIKSKVSNSDEKKYLSNNYNKANWLVNSLAHRAQTILRVSREIVTEQQKFFEKGINYIKPMKLEDIAIKLDINKSTVSRVTSNKYLATPIGLFELKYFFSSSISDVYGDEAQSSKKIKYMIKQLVKEEKSDNVLSDEQIAIHLKLSNINISRRTVTKYREAINLPSSAVRKREKRLENV